MITVMKECYRKLGLEMQITDLANASAHKSQAEVTKDFIAGASYMLRVAVGGGDGGKVGEISRGAKKNKSSPLWKTD
jgi:hypothetical protein